MAENLNYPTSILPDSEQLDNQIIERHFLYDDLAGYESLG